VKDVPFSQQGDNEILSAHGNERRAKIIKDFIGRDISNLRTLDIGNSNIIGQLVGIKDNTWGDLNRSLRIFGHTAGYKYDLILSSEIFEHLMNPLTHLQDIYEQLKPGGTLILATPIQRRVLGWYELDKHFVEYRPWRLKQLFLYVGFKPIKYHTYCIWKWFPFALTGVRPLLRCLFHRSQLWELEKPHK
jgi:SAM-dependent methyltransferase